MKKITRKFICALMLLFLYSTMAFSETDDKNLIQMAILLDTSGSMDGLINQAKTQLWKIVNEFAIAKKDGKNPNLEVALYEYGKDSISRKKGHLRMIVPLSNDLDKISDELFKLTTNGGEEYCGQVIDSSVKNLKWNKSNDVFKVIFIAGNEAFTQGTLNYIDAVKNSIANGIIVNTIFCGDMQEGIDSKWKHGADLADGKYMNIDQNTQSVAIDAPQDDEIIKLGKELNKTYIHFGYQGAKMKENQLAQDSNALSMGKSSMINRSLTKSKKIYKNTSWDLVDAVEEESIEVEKIKKDDLPDEMKNMTKEEKKEFVTKMKKTRDNLNKQLEKLEKERRSFIFEEQKKKSKENTLDTVIINTIREQVSKKNFKFEE